VSDLVELGTESSLVRLTFAGSVRELKEIVNMITKLEKICYELMSFV
jgi:hypothetical protein